MHYRNSGILALLGKFGNYPLLKIEVPLRIDHILGGSSKVLQIESVPYANFKLVRLLDLESLYRILCASFTCLRFFLVGLDFR